MNETCRILVVDDDAGFSEMLKRQLSRLGYSCATADGGTAALKALRTDDFDVAFVDLFMPEMDGMALLAAMGEANLDTVPVVLSGRANIDTAVEAMKRGAFDYIEKEPDIEILRSTVERAASHRRVRRQARQMSETARQWEATFDAVPDLMAIIDTEHRFVRVNKAMADRLGCTAEEAAGRTCYECVHGLDEPHESCPHAQLLEDKQEHIASITEERLGGHFVISTSPLYDAEGELIGSVHVARDVTDEKEAEEKLREAHRETEGLLASMSSFLIEVSRDLIVRRWNTAAETTFGIPASETLGKPFVDSGIQWDWDVLSPQLESWSKIAEPIRLPETRFVRSDGRDGVLGVTVNAIQDDGASLGFFLMGSDVTGRKILESQLVQAQKLESIGQLAAGIAHEINTPTQYVGDNLEFLKGAFEDLDRLRTAHDELLAKMGTVPSAVSPRTETGLSPFLLDEALTAKIAELAEDAGVDYLAAQIPKAIDQSIEGVQRVASIVNAMKEFSHPGGKEKELVDLNHCIESTITVSRNEWKYVAEVEKDLDSGLPHVPCLPGEFNQVILNIIVNAAHAIADVAGEGSERKGTITVTTRRDGDWVEVRISDTGSGIPEKARTRIFDPFFTTKEVGKGTGQGLAISHSVIVDKHGGTLTFETEMGKGTTFIIRLPISME